MPPATAPDAPARASRDQLSTARGGIGGPRHILAPRRSAGRAPPHAGAWGGAGAGKGNQPDPGSWGFDVTPIRAGDICHLPGIYLVFGPQGGPLAGATATCRRPHLSPMHVAAQPDQSGSGKMILTGPGAPAGAP